MPGVTGLSALLALGLAVVHLFADRLAFLDRVSVVVGWLVGTITAIRTLTAGVLFAFLGGGIVLNVIKEELPKERESRFWAFAVGAAGYAALLLAV